MLTLLKKNKWRLLLSCILLLAPMGVGLALWNKLPALMAQHWGLDMQANGYGSRTFVVIGMPLIILGAHLLCLLLTALDPRNKEQTRKGIAMVFWIMPALSIFVAAITYTTAFGIMPSLKYLFLFLGALFAIMGNYMPKLRANHTVGIKLPWTVYNEENWQKTHRLTGKLWMVLGVLIMVCAFLPNTVAWIGFVVLLAGGTVVPAVYSYRYYKKQLREGTAEPILRTAKQKRADKIGIAVTAVMLALVAIFVPILMFTGKIAVSYGEEALSVKATFHEEYRITYESITAVEYREDGDLGIRMYGFSSPRLSVGAFQSDELGAYTRYSYTAPAAFVLLSVNGKSVVLGGKDDAATKEIYEKICEKIGK